MYPTYTFTLAQLTQARLRYDRTFKRKARQTQRRQYQHEEKRQGYKAANRTASSLDEGAAQSLLALNRLEQRLEVARPKAGEVAALDDLDEDRRSVHEVLPVVSIALNRR